MFIALEVSLDVVRALAPVVVAVAKRDPSLADQIRRAASSTVLNLAEGSKRAGKDALHHFRIAAGSAAEARVALALAAAWGHVVPPPPELDELLDRQAALLHRLVFKR